MSMKKLSVIVPVYNSEKYLTRCLNSLLNQGIDDGYEILCINDGSTDRSGEILAQYEKEHPKVVRVITQPNGGVIAARNRGLDEATGEYITFCDNDDYIIPGAYLYLFEHFIDSRVDVLMFQPLTLDKKTLSHWKEDNDPSGKVICEGLGREVYIVPHFSAVWNHIYKKDYLERYHFRLPSVIIGEDTLFNMDVFLSNPYVRIVSCQVYRYTVNKEQVTSSRSPEKMKKMLQSYIYEFQKRTDCMNQCGNNEKRLKECIDSRRYGATNAFFSRMMSARLDNHEYKEILFTLKNIGWLPLPNSYKGSQIIKMITCSYFSYCLLSFLYRNLFVKLILPRLSRS